MVLIKEIESALQPKDTDVVDPEEEDFEVVAKTKISHNEDHEEIAPGSIRKHVEADMRVAYPGKPTSRKRIFNSGLKDKEKPLLTVSESDHDDDDAEDSDKCSVEYEDTEGAESEVDSNDEEDDNEGHSEDEIDSNDDVDDEEDSEDGDDSSDYGGSITGYGEDSKLSDEDESEEDSQGINIFSAQARDIKSDIEKGKSIRNQLTIWEKLIECRIKLQPGLINTNKLYQCEALKEFKNQLNTEEEEVVSQTYSVLSKLMKGLLELQEVTLNAAPEYRDIMNLKRKNDDPSADEEPEEKKKKKRRFPTSNS